MVLAHPGIGTLLCTDPSRSVQKMVNNYKEHQVSRGHFRFERMFTRSEVKTTYCQEAFGPFIKLELFLLLLLLSDSKWHNLSKIMSGKVTLVANPMAPFCPVQGRELCVFSSSMKGTLTNYLH